MKTTIEDLQEFAQFTGTIGYDAIEESWHIIVQAGEAWLDVVYITDQEVESIYSAIRTPNLPTLISDFIGALKAN